MYNLCGFRSASLFLCSMPGASFQHDKLSFDSNKLLCNQLFTLQENQLGLLQAWLNPEAKLTISRENLVSTVELPVHCVLVCLQADGPSSSL